MATTGLFIVASYLLALTIPDSMDQVRAGAFTILGLQGMAYITIAVIRGVWFAWKERETLRQIWTEVCT